MLLHQVLRLGVFGEITPMGMLLVAIGKKQLYMPAYYPMDRLE